MGMFAVSCVRSGGTYEFVDESVGPGEAGSRLMQDRAQNASDENVPDRSEDVHRNRQTLFVVESH